MLRKARDRKFVCLRKPQPAPDFRGPAAPIPPLCYRALFLTHPQNAVVAFSKTGCIRSERSAGESELCRGEVRKKEAGRLPRHQSWTAVNGMFQNHPAYPTILTQKTGSGIPKAIRLPSNHLIYPLNYRWIGHFTPDNYRFRTDHTDHWPPTTWHLIPYKKMPKTKSHKFQQICWRITGMVLI